MSITDEFRQIWNEKEQRDKVIEARARLQGCRDVIVETVTLIEEIVASGTFETIPLETKQAIQRARNIIKDAKSELGEASVREILDWRPE